jgi:hypothetical protein
MIKRRRENVLGYTPGGIVDIPELLKIERLVIIF